MTYEYLLSGLPELQAGSVSPISMEKLLELLDECLSKSDKKLLNLLRNNSKAPLKEGSSLDEVSTNSRQSLDEVSTTSLPDHDDLPEAYQSLSRVDLETALNYEKGLRSKNKFIRDWFAFNQDMNNVLVAQICRKHGFDVKKMIIGQGEVADKLRSNSSQKDFGLSEVMDDYESILALAQIDDLMAREKAQDAIRFEWLQDRTCFDFFSIEQVLAYYLEASILDRWSILTVEQGEEIFRGLVSEMKKGINLDA